MTNKIPVGATIARAYGFAFGNFLNNLGVIWIPVAILYGLVFYFHDTYMNAMTAFVSQDFEAIRRVLPFFFAGYAIAFVLLTAQVAALTKEAMGLRTGSAWLQFPFGAAMWRLLVGYIALFLVCIVLYFATILVTILGGVAGGMAAKLASGTSTPLVVGGVMGIFALAVGCAFIYSAVRLSFLMAPAAVDGPQALRRGWALTRGNFWRIFVIGLSIFIPLLVLEMAYFYFVLGPDFLLPPHLSGMTQQALAQWEDHRRATTIALVQHTQRLWYILYPVGLVFSVIIYGLMTGVSAFAYRALVPLDQAIPDSPE